MSGANFKVPGVELTIQEMGKMKIKIFSILMVLAYSVWGRSSYYLKTNPDSLKEFSNITFLTTGNILNEDSVYCQKLVLENNEQSKSNKSVSKFGCKELKVTEFTFFGYQGEYVRLLYKPIGSKSEYFGKAKIKKIDILNVYTEVNEEIQKNRISEKQADKITGSIAIAAIVVIAVSALVFYFLSSAGGLIPIYGRL